MPETIRKMQLGVKAFKSDSRTLRMRSYMGPGLPPPPESLDWSKEIKDWGMMLNDELGDCTIAGCGHAVQVWNLNGSNVLTTVADADILAHYELWDDYNPKDPSTDEGGVELDVLTRWKAEGFAGHTLTGFADPNIADLNEVRQSIMLMGGVYIGMWISNALSRQLQQDDYNPAVVWDVPADDKDNGIEGGHCVFVCAYDQETFSFISWGKLYKMTTAFWLKYVQEAHALLSPDWIGTLGAPNGFNLEQLAADLAAIH